MGSDTPTEEATICKVFVLGLNKKVVKGLVQTVEGVMANYSTDDEAIPGFNPDLVIMAPSYETDSLKSAFDLKQNGYLGPMYLYGEVTERIWNSHKSLFEGRMDTLEELEGILKKYLGSE